MILFCLLLVVVLGILIGLDREIYGYFVGIRIYVFVCFGVIFFIIINFYVEVVD